MNKTITTGTGLRLPGPHYERAARTDLELEVRTRSRAKVNDIGFGT